MPYILRDRLACLMYDFDLLATVCADVYRLDYSCYKRFSTCQGRHIVLF